MPPSRISLTCPELVQLTFSNSLKSFLLDQFFALFDLLILEFLDFNFIFSTIFDLTFFSFLNSILEDCFSYPKVSNAWRRSGRLPMRWLTGALGPAC